MMKGGVWSNNTEGWCVIYQYTSQKNKKLWNWLWWRVVRDLTIHNQRKLGTMGSGEEGKWTKGGGNDGTWWRWEVVTMGCDDDGKWWGMKRWRRQVVSWGGSRSTKPCVFPCKVAAGDDERYLVCATGAAAVVPDAIGSCYVFCNKWLFLCA